MMILPQQSKDSVHLQSQSLHLSLFSLVNSIRRYVQSCCYGMFCDRQHSHRFRPGPVVYGVKRRTAMAGTMDDNEQEPALQTNSSMHPSKSIPQARIDSNQSRNDSVNAHDNGGVEKGRGSTQNHYGLSSTINHLSVEYDEGRDERNIYETNTKSQVLCLSGEEVDQTANAPWKSAQNDRSQVRPRKARNQRRHFT